MDPHPPIFNLAKLEFVEESPGMLVSGPFTLPDWYVHLRPHSGWNRNQESTAQ